MCLFFYWVILFFVFLNWVSVYFQNSQIFFFFSLDANEGVLTNFEVLDFLRSKGAAKDSTRVLAKVTPSEYKVGFLFLFLLFLYHHPRKMWY
jgi:hypothetical protein